MMLGATRPIVTVVAGLLQKDGLITYHRGRVTILDRETLESVSCECYRTATNLLKAVTDGFGERLKATHTIPAQRYLASPRPRR